MLPEAVPRQDDHALCGVILDHAAAEQRLNL
jgi:hypothetical protein